MLRSLCSHEDAENTSRYALAARCREEYQQSLSTDGFWRRSKNVWTRWKRKAKQLALCCARNNHHGHEYMDFDDLSKDRYEIKSLKTRRYCQDIIVDGLLCMSAKVDFGSALSPT